MGNIIAVPRNAGNAAAGRPPLLLRTMTSLDRNTYRITGLLWVESTGDHNQAVF